MNDSGWPVALLVRRYGIEDPSTSSSCRTSSTCRSGVLKVKNGGGLAGHNGLRSIKSHLHSDAFLRVRIGVGKPPARSRAPTTC